MKLTTPIVQALVSSFVFVAVGCGGSSGDTPEPNSLTPDPSGTAVQPGSLQTNPASPTDPEDLVVSDPVSPPSVAQPERDSIENLFGQVNLQYRFEGNGYRGDDYSISFTFNAASEVAPTLGYRTVESRKIGSYGFDEVLTCAEFLGWDFFCLYADFVSNDAAFFEAFVISMDSQFTGSGNYENCLFSTAEQCGNDVVLDPDGTADLTISRTAQTSSIPPTLNGIPTTVAEMRDFKMASTLQQTKAATANNTTPSDSLTQQLLVALLSRIQ